MGRILELDSLRGLAALVIVLAHIGRIPGSRWALSAVDLFFVISGYLITTNILKNAGGPRFLSVFFVRRALRIWPAYFVALAACLALNRSLKWDAPPDAWPYYLTFTQNVQAYLGWPLPKFSGMFVHTWTLAIEEQFYVLWPLLMFRAGRRGMYAVAVTFALVPPLARSLGFLPYLLLTRSDGLALGSLLALILSERARIERHAVAFGAGFSAVGMLAIASHCLVGADALFTSQTAVVYFGLIGFVLCAKGHPYLALLRDRRLCYLGTVSYGLYLYHPLVFAALPALYKRYVFRKLGLTSDLLMDAVMIGVCLLLAEASSRWLEGPILALKDRLKYGTTGPVSAYRGPHAAPKAVAAAEAR